eukprot:TRINITY_DN841_c0_g3_i1.p1 TRINITY_DN841_c0_g3~~TRINITY_DN841_c0_g3_i1.p1  ORF type:complete len:448 (+),score=70.91 TRINITY_DN841_c0_g3_i1:157-1500(+)
MTCVDATWDALEKLLGHSSLRGSWDKTCFITRHDSGVKYSGVGHELMTDDNRLREAIKETYTDCCRVDEDCNWTSVDPNDVPAEEKWRLHTEEGWSLRYAVGHEVTPSIHDYLYKVQLLSEGHPVGANVYATPGGERGFSRHCDPQNILVTQLVGSKKWTITLHELNSVDHDLEEMDDISEAAIPIIASDYSGPLTIGVVVLYPGDRLYLPRGFAHSCKTEPHCVRSVHLTVDISFGCSLGSLHNLLLRSLSLPVRQSHKYDDSSKLTLPFGWIFMGGTMYKDGPLAKQAAAIALSDPEVRNCLHSEGGIVKLVNQVIDSHADYFFASAIPRPPGDRSRQCYRLSLTGTGFVEITTFPNPKTALSDPDRSAQHVIVPKCIGCLSEVQIDITFSDSLITECDHDGDCQQTLSEFRNNLQQCGIALDQGRKYHPRNHNEDNNGIKRRKQ